MLEGYINREKLQFSSLNFKSVLYTCNCVNVGCIKCFIGGRVSQWLESVGITNCITVYLWVVFKSVVRVVEGVSGQNQMG